MPGRIRSWSDTELKAAVSSLRSLAQVLTALGLRAAGGNYRTVARAIEVAEIHTSHFGGQAWSSGKNFGPRRPVERYLSNEFPIGSYRLKLRLLAEGIFEPVCKGCGLTEWRGQSIPLELEHRDGDPENNRLENLELLCTNCHAQTPTYRSKNRKRA